MAEKMLKRILHFLSGRRVVIGLVVLLSLTASIQSLVSGTKTYHEGGREYNRYNNYTMFEKSFHHLRNQQDLYQLYPEEYWDLYKYTPSFTAFFGLFAMFPDWLGLSLWNLFNAVILILAVYYLPYPDKKGKGIILLIVLIELMTAMQNEQSNPLITGLLVLAFGSLERKKYFPAAFFILFSAFIKPYGIVGMAMFLLYPGKWKMALGTALSFVLIMSFPLLFIDLPQYKFLLVRYLETLRTDQGVQLGLSLMGLLDSWFSMNIPKNVVLGSGIILFLLPMLRWKKYHQYLFRYLVLASILIWIVIFNYRAESPTYIIAITGVALWFVPAVKSPLNIALFVMAVLLTVLSPTDLFPAVLRKNYVIPFVLKALPCILIWIRIQYELLTIQSVDPEQIQPSCENGSAD